MQVFNFLMIKVDGPIILGNLKVEFLIEILMQFFFKVIESKFPCHFCFLQFNSSCFKTVPIMILRPT